MRDGRARKALAFSIGLVLMAGLSACVESERDSAGGGGSGDTSADTFVFAASADPGTLDPAFANDGESFRVARQIFEGLVGTVPGTPDPAPRLAESWVSSEDGLTHTFTLHEGVKFHDGTDFNADAVCVNFNRWNNFTGVLQSESISYYWQKIMGGFATSDDPALADSILAGCQANSPTAVTITLKKPFGAFIPALSLPAFAISSPAALEQYNADEVTGTGEAPQFGEYANAHPTGTGPFTFESWDRGQQVVLNSNAGYWGEKPSFSRIVFRVIDDTTARKQALESGSIDGYDLVAPADVQGLADGGYEIVNRDPFNILYLGMNQAFPAMADIRVRQAIAHAVNKQALVQAQLPEGTELATQFIPPSVNGFASDVATYDHDPERAKALLAEAGFAAGQLELPFWYPTGVSRPYLPTPEETFTAIRADLEAVGIVITPVAKQWSPDYLDGVQGTSEGRALHLLGWTGDYNDTDNFIGVFFGAAAKEWGFDNPELFTALATARGLPAAEAEAAYQDINRTVMEFLPGVPLAHPTPSLAFNERVDNYPASPVQDEVYNVVTLTAGR